MGAGEGRNEKKTCFLLIRLFILLVSFIWDSFTNNDKSISIPVFTVMCAILDRTPEGNIQGRIKGRDALGLRLGRA